MEEFVKPFKALSDETRLRILNILVKQECCVCEVMQALNISQSRASRNLGILEEAGFLKSHHEGAWVHYTLRDDSSNFAVMLAKMTGEFSDEDDLFKQDRERLKKAKRLGLCCTQKLSGRQKVSADK
jgi:ArsR family transcriptional regulator, arsenate/arsenite/antimonite-responsive transcriptional repressor